MVIGNGLMARAFEKYQSNSNVVIFASGVSNSTTINFLEYNREFNLLKDIVAKYAHCTIVYFSTLSILDNSVKDKPYVQHKLQMELYIEQHALQYYIFRISNVVGKTNNKYTILNYLATAVNTGLPIEIWQQAQRNLIDVADVVYMVTDIVENGMGNKITTIASHCTLPVPVILNEIERHFNQKANAQFVAKGLPLTINTEHLTPYFKQIEQQKGSGINYLKYLLNTYY